MNRSELHEEGGERWTVKNNILSDGHSAIISLANAPSHKISGNKILRGGQIGIKGAGSGSIIRSNEIAYGNTERYCYSAACGLGEAGGVKFAANVRNTVFDHNVVHDNFGKGVHYDIDCSNNTASNNRIYDNARMGLHMELCYSGKIFGNVIYDNGYATPEEGAGLVVHASENIEIYGNTVAYNPGGIVVVNRDRPNHTLVHDVVVHNNTIISQDGYGALVWERSDGGDMFAPSADNRGRDNLYYYPVAENGRTRFAWDGPITRLAAFNATPGEERGRYLSTAEKDAVLAEKGIPARP
jgi:parallel beta-helix repeat protein